MLLCSQRLQNTPYTCVRPQNEQQGTPGTLPGAVTSGLTVRVAVGPFELMNDIRPATPGWRVFTCWDSMRMKINTHMQVVEALLRGS